MSERFESGVDYSDKRRHSDIGYKYSKLNTETKEIVECDIYMSHGLNYLLSLLNHWNKTSEGKFIYWW